MGLEIPFNRLFLVATGSRLFLTSLEEVLSVRRFRQLPRKLSNTYNRGMDD